jgi:hypothetical protein
MKRLIDGVSSVSGSFDAVGGVDNRLGVLTCFRSSTDVSFNASTSTTVVAPTSERGGNNLKRFKGLNLEAKARIWP